MAPDDVIASWVRDLPDPCTSEHVRPGFWYVRIPARARSWIPVEIEVGMRTVKVTSYVIIPPDEGHADVYELLLRHNYAVKGAAFAVAPDGLLCLVGRIPREDLGADALDAVVGSIVEATEITFRSVLQLGFARRLRRG